MSLRKLLEGWTSGRLDPPPVVRLIGLQLVAHGQGTAEVELPADQRHHNAMGTVHGGILCDAADVAMGVALATVVEEGETFTTLGIQMNYFRQIRQSKLTAAAKVVRRGRTTAYCECDILDDEGAPVAKATSTCLILAHRSARGGESP